MSLVALVLLACALALLLGAEWPRLSRRVGSEAVARRSRERRKRKLTVVPTEVDEADDFVASVERDLANLPTIEERDRQ